MFRESIFRNRATLVWEPREARKVGILLLHGYGEHARRYRTFGDRLANDGYHVFAIEHMGHGKSAGRRAYIPDFSALREETAAWFDLLRQNHPGYRWGVFGHSMGGLIGTWLTLDRPEHVSALMLSGPLIDPPAGISEVVKRIARLLAVVAPILPAVPFDVEGICRDPEVVRRFRADPLVYNGKIRVGTGIQLENAIRDVLPRLGEIQAPMWIGHGSLDRLAMPSGSLRLLQMANSQDKERKLYNGLYHEILNEPEGEVVLHDLTWWLKKRLS
jgi:alpha-beta hydrolase superfamily lysophospholipase